MITSGEIMMQAILLVFPTHPKWENKANLILILFLLLSTLFVSNGRMLERK